MPGAAELPNQAAHTYRQQCFHSLQARWLMPQVMLQLTTFETQPPAAAAAAGTANGISSEQTTGAAQQMLFNLGSEMHS